MQALADPERGNLIFFPVSHVHFFDGGYKYSQTVNGGPWPNLPSGFATVAQVGGFTGSKSPNKSITVKKPRFKNTTKFCGRRQKSETSEIIQSCGVQAYIPGRQKAPQCQGWVFGVCGVSTAIGSTNQSLHRRQTSRKINPTIEYTLVLASWAYLGFLEVQPPNELVIVIKYYKCIEIRPKSNVTHPRNPNPNTFLATLLVQAF